MSNIPQIRLIFLLTKNDCADFDRDAVTHCLGIMPSMSTAPTVSKGRLNSVAEIRELEQELAGFTILPAQSPPYKMIKHACWSIDLPKIECWNLEEPLQKMEQLFSGKENKVLSVCKEYNLSADLLIRIFAESNCMPELTIPGGSVSFWASMGVSIGFDFYLD